MPRKTKYERFIWRREWMQFEMSLPIEERKAFSMAIAHYGCRGELCINLNGDVADFFNSKVIPDLDAQHERLMKGLELW